MSEKERQKMMADRRSDTDRILTLPNILSFFRLALIPLIVWLYEAGYYGWAFAMLLLSGATDVIDGYIARTFRLVSDFGKAIDPIADKLTQIAVLLCLLDLRHWWVIGVLCLKELSIGILSLVTIRRTHRVYSAGWYGKLCTVVIYLSMFVLILWREAPQWFVTVDGIIISLLVVLALVKYAVYYAGILKEAKEG